MTERLKLHQIDPYEAEHAADDWRFSCGPAAICAVTGLNPTQVRSHLAGDYRGWMNPTEMRAALISIGALDPAGDRILSKDHPQPWPRYGVCRVQWGGPWCAPGVPPRAAYKHTHWVAAASGWPEQAKPLFVFDVNGIGVVQWMSFEQWRDQMVPFLLEDKKRADGTWWITHSMEVRWP